MINNAGYIATPNNKIASSNLFTGHEEIMANIENKAFGMPLAIYISIGLMPSRKTPVQSNNDFISYFANAANTGAQNCASERSGSVWSCYVSFAFSILEK